jgi:adenosylcobinamide-phosphate synthase
MIFFFIDVVAAFILDLVFGDPYRLPHPVRLIGILSVKLEKAFLKWAGQSIQKQKFYGVVFAILVVSSSFLTVFFILRIASLINPVLFHVLNIFLIYTSMASGCLAYEARKMKGILEKNDIARARKELSMLVGRDTEKLEGPVVIRAVVETTAENTVDGVISTIFYTVVGSLIGMGAPLAIAYKAVSTLDSMYGYRNEKYVNFGYMSAKLDDYANYLPARLSGVIIPVAAKIMGKSFMRSFKIMKRDRRRHKSPNSAYPEAAFAGALGIRLGGNSTYGGVIVKKPYIGDNVREPVLQDIEDSTRIMLAASFLSIVLFTGLLLITGLCLKN